MYIIAANINLITQKRVGCIVYIYHRYHGVSYYNIFNRFSLVDLDYNQKLIIDIFNNYN